LVKKYFHTAAKIRRLYRKSFLDYVKFATNAIQNAANKPGHPSVVSKAAIIEAAKRHYPIILRKKISVITNGKEYGYEQGYPGEYLSEEIYSEEIADEEIADEEIADEEIFSEVDEMQLASELLSVTNDQELDFFLGKLIRKAARAVKGFAKSGIGRAIGGVIKNVAKKVIPIAGGALGTFFGGPVGGMVGSKLGTFASGLFEIEPEGLSAEDMEFATSRGFVMFAGKAARLAARSDRFTHPNIARNAFMGAAEGMHPDY
jgi:hypothetical protein